MVKRCRYRVDKSVFRYILQMHLNIVEAHRCIDIIIFETAVNAENATRDHLGAARVETAFATAAANMNGLRFKGSSRRVLYGFV